MTVNVEIDDRLATLTINRPEVRNALSRQVLADQRAALHRLRDNDAVGVVAFTGAGTKAFVAGADITQLQHYTLHWTRRCSGCSTKSRRSRSRPSPRSTGSPWAAAASWPCPVTSGSPASTAGWASSRSRCSKEIPGFVANRILHALRDEAIFLLEQGIASVEDIDIACRTALGYPMGPFELMDLTGIDIAYHAKLARHAVSQRPAGPAQPHRHRARRARRPRPQDRAGFYSYEEQTTGTSHAPLPARTDTP